MLTDLVQDPVPETTTPERSENVDADADAPPIVREEKQLLTVVLRKLDAGAPRKSRIQVDDASALIELRDALAEAKPEDQGSILEQMHRIEALSRQRGKGDTPPVDRKSPYFGHLRLEENGKRRDVLVGARSFVEPGGGVQIVDWRNAPVSRLFYRYEEGDAYEERLGDRLVEGEVLARRTVAIVDSDLRRVASPQGTFSRDLRTGAWREIAARQARLQIARDGSAAALLPASTPSAAPASAPVPAEAPAPAVRGKLGLDENGARRPDRHLPAIAALIDPRQFELITQPASGLIAVQGSAGSGKTTIGLHRIAYLAFADPRRFRPEKMLVIVYQRALAAYVSRVLPSLDVPGVPVMTFGSWAEAARRAAFPLLDFDLTEETPPVVMRAKAHGAFLRIIDDRQAAIAVWCRQRLADDLGDKAEAAAVLAFWDGTTGPVDGRVTALAQWVRDTTLDPATRNAVENAGRMLRARTRDATGEWAAMLTDRAALGEGFARHAPGVFSPGQLDDLHRWCVERERLRGAGRGPSVASSDGGEDERYALDAEDEALLLRVFQRQRGRIPDRAGSKTTLAYEHLMVDEVQDFSPLELAVLLDTTSAQRSVTLAGDTAQAIAPEHGFSDWAALLDFLEIAHERVEPLRVSYRSTREIVDAAEHVLGPLMGDIRPVAPRAGAPVESFPFGSAGESAEFLSHALKELVRAEPDASVALLARHPEQARLYYEALANAEVPNLRLVGDQDFSFTAGIDVTDVRQSKGLEFDIVILLEVTETSYPASDDARRLLHVAMTRAAHQLWVTYTGAPSPLLPDGLR
ncbi:MAG TPA: 3'-5' exonuclease [Polyangia bacterium]|jgi:DNA helicase-2/ATP-dependent DNA helicase PcrA|nr:3'-5' exonuclease [Polyangia bacterium]